MGSAEENRRLLDTMDANRRFFIEILLANPALLAQAEPRLQEWLRPAAEGLPPVTGQTTPPAGSR